MSDDITTTADGVDTYHLVKSAGRYKLDIYLIIFLLSTIYGFFSKLLLAEIDSIAVFCG